MAVLATAGTALAHSDVAMQSVVFVERINPDQSRRLEPADRLNRGDRVITVVNWQRQTGNGSFVITNPLPAALAYQGSAWDDQDVSVDGGRSWGRLSKLHVGGRSAVPEDVTHVRWRIPARNRARGQIAYSGIVR
ncbi:hypothetical protein [Novosphingobium sp. 9U]|uniref:hypothetical protein n=1 Tax=Novosphingobium sp. 9U TaxID=2653158 RepID=UPI001915D94A|nr:hypothetical protein [Novosphingobium sp. 9U]